MKRAAQWMMIVPMSFILVAWGVALVSAYVRRGPNGMLIGLPCLFLAFEFSVPGALLWLAGWIVEGFHADAH